MDIVWISARRRARSADAAPRPHPSREFVEKHLGPLARAGHDVRWLCPIDADEDESVADSGRARGVEITTCRAERPPHAFRDVLGPLGDLEAERTLQRMLRSRRADVVHVFGFGTPGSFTLPWIAERMGAAGIFATADTPAALCHRGTFVDSTGEECRDHGDPARCTACCLTADGRGDALGPVSAWFGRRSRGFGDASPWPDAASFASRLDVVVGSALLVDALFVEDEAAAERWERLGVPERVLSEPPAAAVDDLLARYGRGAVSSATSSR